MYIEEMRDAVKVALDNGQSEMEIIASDIGAGYKKWVTYDMCRDLNIRGMIRWLKETGQAG